jgi:hypothetical protein
MKYCIPFIVLTLISCKNGTEKAYTNKSHYSIAIGDTLEIYYTTNSCCQYCQPNQEQLKHLKYIGRKTIIKEPKDCVGCSQTSALLFVAKSKGIDTIKDATIGPLDNCSDLIKGLTNYIIQIHN